MSWVLQGQGQSSDGCPQQSKSKTLLSNLEICGNKKWEQYNNRAMMRA